MSGRVASKPLYYLVFYVLSIRFWDSTIPQPDTRIHTLADLSRIKQKVKPVLVRHCYGTGLG